MKSIPTTHATVPPPPCFTPARCSQHCWVSTKCSTLFRGQKGPPFHVFQHAFGQTENRMSYDTELTRMECEHYVSHCSYLHLYTSTDELQSPICQWIQFYLYCCGASAIYFILFYYFPQIYPWKEILFHLMPVTFIELKDIRSLFFFFR